MDLALRLIVAAVLVAAAVAKARDLTAAAERLGDHGVRPGLRPLLARALVAVEAGLGVAVASGAAGPVFPAAAAALFAGFAAAYVRLRLAGVRRAGCGCFGGSAQRPTLLIAARAAALAAVAGVAAVGAPSLDAPAGDVALWAALAVLAAAVAALTVLVLALYRQVGVLSLRIAPRAALDIEHEGPQVGERAPDLRSLVRTGPELVAFSSPGCRLCAELAPGLRALERGGLAVRHLADDTDPDAFTRWNVPGTPYVVYLEDGVVAAKGLVNTLEQVDGVVAAGRERRAAA